MRYTTNLRDCREFVVGTTYPRSAILVRPDAKTPGPCLRAFRLAPKVHARELGFALLLDFPSFLSSRVDDLNSGRTTSGSTSHTDDNGLTKLIPIFVSCSGREPPESVARCARG